MVSPAAAAAALKSVERALRQLSQVPSRAAGPASTSIAELIQQEFASGTDPYGKAWRPLKKSTVRRKGNSRPNIDTNDLRDSIDVRPMSGAGVQITLGVDYAAFVQLARPVLPTRGLPKSWASAIAKATDNAKRDWARSAGAGAPVIDAADAMLELAQLLGSLPSE